MVRQDYDVSVVTSIILIVLALRIGAGQASDPHTLSNIVLQRGQPPEVIVTPDGERNQVNSRAASEGRSVPAFSLGPKVESVARQNGQSSSDTNDMERRLATYTLLLVIVGFLQFLILAATLFILYLQTRLNEFSLQQWVHVGDWTVEKEVETGESHHEVTCKFQLTNKTERPLTLLRVVTNVAIMMGTKSAPESYEVTENLMLPPDTDSGYVCRVPVRLRKKEFDQFKAHKLFVFFRGKIFIRGPRGRETAQWFKQLGQLGPNRFVLYIPHGAVPEAVSDGGFKETV